METIGIIHQLARSGGTLLNRCLGCMPAVSMLSEIHPNMGNRLDQYHALVQAQQWFGIFSDSDIERLKQHKAEQWAGWTFADSIALIQKRSRQQQHKLVIRDFNNADFVATPKNTPTFRSQTVEQLRDRHTLQRIALVRHPLHHWCSVQEYRWSKNRCSLKDFLYGYYQFAQMSVDVGFIRYEDFCQNPDSQLHELCQRLCLPFDERYKQTRTSYRKVTGDQSRDQNDPIQLRVRPPADSELLEQLKDSQDYQRSLELLGYNESLTQQ
jgi:hypothetical protein